MMFGNQQMNPALMQMLMQQMGGTPIGGGVSNPGMPQIQNNAPQLPIAQHGGVSGQMPQPQQQQQQPNFMQNMFSSPQQLASGISVGGDISKGAQGLWGTPTQTASGPMMNGSAGYQTGGSGIQGMFGNMFGAGGPAGEAGATGLDSVAAPALSQVAPSAAGSALGASSGAALGMDGTAASGSISMADILGFLGMAAA